MEYEKITPLARSLDMKVSSNRNIVILVFFTFLLYSLTNLFWNSDYSASTGIHLAAVVFTSWVVARELDPDNHITANITAVLTLLYTVFLFSNSKFELLTGVVAIALMRMIGRTVGITFRLIELTAILLLGIYAGYVYSWYLLFVVGIAFIYDAALHKQNAKAYFFAIPSFLGAFYLAAQQDNNLAINLADSFVALWGLILCFVTSILIFKDIQAKTDVTDEKLLPARVFASRVAFLMVFFYAILTTQLDDIYTHIAIWIPLWVYSFVNLFKKMISTFSKSKR